MIKIKNSNFSVKQICESGQCFRLEKIRDCKYAVIAFGKYLELEQEQNEITFFCTPEEYAEVWERYQDIGAGYLGSYYYLYHFTAK